MKVKLSAKNFWIAGLLLVILGIGNKAIAQKQDLIPWSSDLELKWKDFKGKPDKFTDLKAITSSGIKFGAKCVNGELMLTIGCYFDRKDSWVKGEQNEYLLAHEKLHFDITELYTRKLIQKLTSLSDPCGKDLDKMQQIYDDNSVDYNAFQDRYDRETDHSLNKEKQKEWEELVARELKRLEMYSSELYSQERF